jgi:hypothetical protein
MGKTLEFDFGEEGLLRLELLAEGELRIHLQARHPGDGWKVTSTAVAVDAAKTAAIREWLNGGAE